MLLFLFLSCVLLSTGTAQRTSNVSLGSSISPINSSFWSSNSGNFAFGFYPKGDGFAVGIWFAQIQQQTVIWTANRDDPPLPGDTTLILTNNGSLILQMNDRRQIPISNAVQAASSASMLDTGNFVLYDSESRIIWQTFDFPTDTILPGQRLLAGKQLVSGVSDTNHTRGIFRLIMQLDGNLVMYSKGNPITGSYPYWSSKTLGSGNNVTLILDSNGQLYLINSTAFNIKTLKDSSSAVLGNRLYRATVDSGGLFILYSHNVDRNGNWSIEWSSSNNRCDPIGLCGLNSYCTIVDQSPSCVCAPGFDFIDQSNKNSGCQRKSYLVDCMSLAEINFTTLQDISWEDNPYSVVNSSSEIACREECLGDCSCGAAIYSNRECRKQKFPLRFGRFQNAASITTFVKIGEGRQKHVDDSSTNSKKKLQIGILVAGITCLSLGFIVLSIFGFLSFRNRVWEYKSIFVPTNGDLAWDVTLRSFTYQELESATNGFTDKLGRGAFGTVFKGALANGQTHIAVKRLEKVMDEGEVEFQNEMRSIGRTHHRNLVRLIGYCHDKSNILLVYEYMNNGSLADFLFKSEITPNWENRIQIALDIARGILYLHKECENQIIHCDINPKNILMDENWCAKISDFGLAKLLIADQSKTVTGIRGTRGYVAPEWYKNQPITTKADVYSFGIVFLEIICCRRSVKMDVTGDEAILAEWLYKCFEENELEKLLITTEDSVDVQILKRMVSIGLWCIQDEPSLRLSMKKVVLMLEGIVEVPNPPSSNSFSNVL